MGKREKVREESPPPPLSYFTFYRITLPSPITHAMQARSKIVVRGGGTAEGEGLGGFNPSPLPLFGWGKIFYLILLNHIHHLQRQLTLHINKYIKVFSDKLERTTESQP